jgi:protocatechuate 3,4-dioxygenase alpha subunit
VFARGLLRHLITRMYFSGEAGNGSDSLLQMVPEDRRATLIAREAIGDANTYEWNVVLQGPDETVFFAW